MACQQQRLHGWPELINNGIHRSLSHTYPWVKSEDKINQANNTQLGTKTWIRYPAIPTKYQPGNYCT